MENRSEYLQPDLQEVNLSNSCRTRLTQAGRHQYEEYYRKLGIPSRQHEESPEGSRFQLHELMNIFGSSMYMGSDKLPFENNEITLEAEKSAQQASPRKFNINDPIYVELTLEGKRKLEERYRGITPHLKTRGHLTEFQFYEVANIFGPEFAIGNPRLPIETTFYIEPPHASLH